MVEAGVPEWVIAHRVRAGLWWRRLPGVIATFPKMKLSTRQQRMAALLWLPPCALLSHFDPAQRARDEASDLEMTSDGWVVVRLRSDRTRRVPHEVVSQLTRLRALRTGLSAAGHITPAVRAAAA